MVEPSAPATEAARAGTHLSIGEVLALLLEEFPDVTISKIRFLESQGLIDPERTASGYRKFYGDDVELLRCILREQRENYLPLRVIKDRIDSGEIDPTGELPQPATTPRGIKNVTGGAAATTSPTSGSTGHAHPSAGNAVYGAAALFQRTDEQAANPPAGPPPGTTSPADNDGAEGSTSTSGRDRAPAATSGTMPPASPTEPATAPAAAAPEEPGRLGAVLPGLLLSADELCAMAALTRQQLAELQRYGVVVAQSGRDDGPFDEDAVEIATISKRFLDAGIEPRHLRGWRVAADREAGLLEQLIQPLLRQRNPEARANAVAQLNELEQIGGRLRHVMMRSALREHGPH